MPELTDDLRAYFDALAERAEQYADRQEPARELRAPERPPRRPLLAAALAVAACLLVVVAVVVVQGRRDAEVSTDPADRARTKVERIGGIPVLVDAVRSPGEKLGDEFEVVDGSLLLGDVFPDTMSGSSAFIPEGRWTATLLVTGDPLTVLQAYADQFQAAGLAPEGQFSCPDYGPFVQEMENLLCRGRWVAPSGREETVDLTYLRGLRGPGDAPVSHLKVSYHRDGERMTGRPPVSPGPVLTEPPPFDAPGFSGDWPELPEPGETYESSLTASNGYEILGVREGVELVAPPTTCSRSSAYGSFAVFKVTGDPTEVLESYIPSERRADSPIRTRRQGDAQVFEADWSGGDNWTATIVVRPGGATYMTLEHCFGD